MPVPPDVFEQQLWAIKSDFGDLSANSFYVRFLDGRTTLDDLLQWAKEFYSRRCSPFCESGTGSRKMRWSFSASISALTKIMVGGPSRSSRGTPRLFMRELAV